MVLTSGAVRRGPVLALTALGGRRLASAATDGTLRVWDAARAEGEERCEAVLKVGEAAITAAVDCGDGEHLVTGGLDGCIRKWALGKLRRASSPNNYMSFWVD